MEFIYMYVNNYLQIRGTYRITSDPSGSMQATTFELPEPIIEDNVLPGVLMSS